MEYFVTLGRHSAAVNVVRFSPNGGLLRIFIHVTDPENLIFR